MHFPLVKITQGKMHNSPCINHLHFTPTADPKPITTIAHHIKIFANFVRRVKH